MAHSAPGTSADTVSDIPLSGFVTGLHIVYNDRTKEQFIVGGADDGSIAFWELE
jgi:WD repeat-containing protein 7